MTHAVERHLDSEKMYFTEHLADVIERAIGLHLTKDVTHLCVAEATIEDRTAVDAVLPPKKGGCIRIALAPFSSTRAKDWPVEYYKAFMEKMSQWANIEYILLGGSGDAEKEFWIPQQTFDLRGRLKLTATA